MSKTRTSITTAENVIAPTISAPEEVESEVVATESVEQKGSKSRVELNDVNVVNSKISVVAVVSKPSQAAVAPAILFHVISGDQVGEEFLVHADCAVGVMMDFIKRRVTEDKNIPEIAYLELFDENGESLGLHKSDPFARGTGFVKHRGVYFPMYFIPENSESDELVGNAEDVKGADSQFGEEWGGESPCEEDDEFDEELQNPNSSDAEGLRRTCVSSSGSSTSVSSTGMHSDKSTKFQLQHPHPSGIHDEEYGEDGHHIHKHHHHHPQMIHSKLEHEFCGEGHHEHRHHHHHKQNVGFSQEQPLVPGPINKPGHKSVEHSQPDEGTANKPGRKSIEQSVEGTVKRGRKSTVQPKESRNNHRKKSIFQPKEGSTKRGRKSTFQPVNEQAHGSESTGEGYLEEHTLNHDPNIDKEHSESQPKASHISESKESVAVSEALGKKSKGVLKKGKKRKSAKTEKSVLHPHVDFSETPETLLIPSVVDEITKVPSNPSLSENAENVTEEIPPDETIESALLSTTIIEVSPPEELELKTEDDEGVKITYSPIISEDFNGCVRICKWVVGLHLEIERGVRETETETVNNEIPVTAPPATQESLVVLGESKKLMKSKSKGKSNTSTKKMAKEAGSENLEGH